MSKFEELAEIGQSIWYDNIRRALLDSGEMADLIKQGVTGVTSNPTIFEKAIAGSKDYDEALHDLVVDKFDVAQIYEKLVLDDIGRTADLLRPVYDQTEGQDGFISIEVNPMLAYDTQGTILEAKQLFADLRRPNVMIKVPATEEGVAAFRTLVGEGINVNVTLIFSIEHYSDVAEAYLAGLEDRMAAGSHDLAVASVASFFVSRVDTAVDRALGGIGAGATAASELKGRAGVANAKVAYARFKEIYSGERWERLAAKGARVQRPLWASTGTKSPTLPDTLYVDSLIGPDTVNTIPPATLHAFMDHGTVSRALEKNLEAAEAHLEQLSAMGLDLVSITADLQEQGVSAFARSYEALMNAIALKRERLLAGWEHLSVNLNGYGPAVDSALEQMSKEKVLSRIWTHDHTVWKPDPDEITNRLGWLNIAEVMLDNLDDLQALSDGARADGYNQALLLGMGGSSLAPEVFLKTFGVKQGHFELAVLDSTDPGAVLSATERFDPARTLYIIATKSGGTVETLSLFKYFYNQVEAVEGAGRTGPHFVAITDPGSRLADIAEQFDFRAIFLNDPNIGGRYSALSFFGLVPAALIGVDVAQVLDRSLSIACASESCVGAIDNPAAKLGAVLAELALQGRDKLTLVASPPLASFGDWLEQLIAESTGKEGHGILPVVGEKLGEPDLYGEDRLFAHLRLDGDDTDDAAIDALQAAGHPIIRIRIHDSYDLGGQYFLWEMATAIAGHRLGINPFDQPNVESAKVLTRELVAAFAAEGGLPEQRPVLVDGDLELYGDISADDLGGAMIAYLKNAAPRSYIALQAYLQPGRELLESLQELRTSLRARTRLATTLGFGPRYLHSTGQLHKGDAGAGSFIQITAEDGRDADIPDEAGSSESSLTFGNLKAAQAMGDRKALEAGGRRVLRLHIKGDLQEGLARVIDAVG
ncbi:MAG: bifunctional transaldolase/phosoglucose isomerase [Chloroflexi bacterium]|nr:bifunctional transaldolase/phosoglucose isomerase [Chloroflexota bacterium]MCI0853847.1 bifunctional transaldolase/phosoglucose isomerase [Chloroflexota bacterium]